MAVKLNLLPQEFVVPKDLSNLLKIARSLGVITLAVFIFFLIGSGGYFIFASQNLKKTEAELANLKSQVQAEEDAEQKMVFLKDRIKKIILVRNVSNSLNNLEKINAVIDLLPGNASLVELSIDLKKTDMSLLFRSSLDLNTFVTTLRENEEFSTVTMSSFSYVPASGYTMSIRFLPK